MIVYAVVCVIDESQESFIRSIFKNEYSAEQIAKDLQDTGEYFAVYIDQHILNEA